MIYGDSVPRHAALRVVLVVAAVVAALPALSAQSSPPARHSILPTEQIQPVTLRDQDDRAVRFPDDVIGERLMAINFVFTRCGTICPPMGAAFGKLQQELRERPDLQVDLLSVSLDPVHDTPERLRSWAARFGRTDGWTLVTGDKPDVDQVLRALDAFTPDKNEHAALLLLGNPATGRWLRIDGLASPRETLEVLTGLATGAEGETVARRSGAKE